MKKITFGVIILLMLSTLLSCGSSKKSEYIFDKEAVCEESVIYETESPMSITTVKKSSVSGYNDYNSSFSNTNYIKERKLIKNGFITLEVDNFENLDSNVKKFVNKFEGYITDTNSDERYVNYTIKIPCERFEEAMEVSGELGKIKYKNQNSQDVTDEYFDLDSRINTKKIMKEKLESYLSQAKDIKDLLEIERQLNEVINELDMFEGRMKRLSNQISYSTINISFNLPTGFTETGFNWPDLGEDFREFAENVVHFFAGLLMFIFYIIVIGIPVLAVVALLYWILFGRIGLLKKLFKFLSKKK